MQQRRSWLAGIGGGLVVIVVGGLIHYAIGFGNSSTRHRPQPSAASPSATKQQSGSHAMDLGVAYGATPKEVLTALGSPTTKRAGCWIYGRAKTPRSYLAIYVDAVKFCFSEGPIGGNVVTYIYNHRPARTIKKKHYPAQWGGLIDIEKPPDWYLQQNA